MRPLSASRATRVVLAAASAAFVTSSVVVPSAAAQTAEWIPPVDGAVVRPFVAPIAEYAAGHRGVDFTAAPGTAVRASNDGTVSFAGSVGATLHVVVAHEGGIRTSYSFLASADVRAGERVRRGQVVGRAGGNGDGHGAGVLHFGVRIGDRYVDPMLLFRPRDLTQMVRLVPPEELAVAERPDRQHEERELARITQEHECSGAIGDAADIVGLGDAAESVCDAAASVAERARDALDEGIDALETAARAGLVALDEIVDAADDALESIVAAGDAVRDALAGTSVGRLVRDLVAGGAALLGWFGRECDETAPPANGRGGSGNALFAVAGFGSDRTRREQRSFDLPAGLLGYDEGDRHWFSYRRGSERYTKPDTHGSLRKKARLLGEQLRRAARAEPGRRFDLIGHSQGGVVIAFFLATVYKGHEDEYPPIGKVVTFASPLNGTPSADLAAAGDSRLGRLVLDAVDGAGVATPDLSATSLRQLVEGSALIDELHDAGLPEGIDFTSIAGVEDTAVPVRSTELDGTRHHAVDVGGPFDSHSKITSDPRALMAARAALEGRAMPCTSFEENLKASIGSTLLAAAERYAAQQASVGPH